MVERAKFKEDTYRLVADKARDSEVDFTGEVKGIIKYYQSSDQSKSYQRQSSLSGKGSFGPNCMTS